MDQPSSSQPPPSSSVSENPVVAVGRRVKSALSSHQQPSVRILRESSAGSPHRVPILGSIAEKLTPHRSSHGTAHQFEAPAELPQTNTTARESSISNRFSDAGSRATASVRSFFSHEKTPTGDESFDCDECDSDTVDLLDVVGT